MRCDILKGFQTDKISFDTNVKALKDVAKWSATLVETRLVHEIYYLRDTGYIPLEELVAKLLRTCREQVFDKKFVRLQTYWNP